MDEAELQEIRETLNEAAASIGKMTLYIAKLTERVDALTKRGNGFAERIIELQNCVVHPEPAQGVPKPGN